MARNLVFSEKFFSMRRSFFFSLGFVLLCAATPVFAENASSTVGSNPFSFQPESSSMDSIATTTHATMERCVHDLDTFAAQLGADYSAASTWPLIHVKSGKFSVRMPYSPDWREQGKALLPYTMLETQPSASVKNMHEIHMGMTRLDDVVCSDFVQNVSLSPKVVLREYQLAWQPVRDRAAALKHSGSIEDPGYPIPIKVGAYNATIDRVSSPLITAFFGGDCVSEFLNVTVKGMVYTFGSECRPLNIHHFRMAASLKLDR